MAEIKTISCDVETYSSVDLAKCGVYKYAESPDFEILLFGYAVDGGEVNVVDLKAGETIPDDILDALTDDRVAKWAFNAQFERVCLSRYLSDLGVSLDPFHDRHPLSTECARFLNPEGWRCSMVWAATLGLPLSLEGVGAVLGLEKQKLTEGKELIRFFCVPCRETKSNGGRTRNLPEHEPENGLVSRHTTHAMWKRRWAFSRSSSISPYRRISGRNTTSTRRSTTGESASTWSLSDRQSAWTNSPEKS